MSQTYAILELSRVAFEEIKTKLEAAGYSDQFYETDEDGTAINMDGIAVRAIKEPNTVSIREIAEGVKRIEQ